MEHDRHPLRRWGIVQGAISSYDKMFSNYQKKK